MCTLSVLYIIIIRSCLSWLVLKLCTLNMLLISQTYVQCAFCNCSKLLYKKTGCLPFFLIHKKSLQKGIVVFDIYLKPFLLLTIKLFVKLAAHVSSWKILILFLIWKAYIYSYILLYDLICCVLGPVYCPWKSKNHGENKNYPITTGFFLVYTGTSNIYFVLGWGIYRRFSTQLQLVDTGAVDWEMSTKYSLYSMHVVVEPLHFDAATAPACQDAGSGILKIRR